jgi:hypothetical protein
MAAGSTYRSHNQRGGRGRGTHHGRGKPFSKGLSNNVAASANAAQQQSLVICYKCGEPGHVATYCPTKNTTGGTSTQRPHTAPPAPARGHSATAQEGDSYTSGMVNSSTRGTSGTAMVCMACTIHYEQAMSAHHLLDYNVNPTMHRPPPQPIPVTETDTTGVQLTNMDRFITMVMPINIGQFNDFLEDHIRSGLVPTVYIGSLNPLDDDFWLLLHNYPLSDQGHTFVAIIYPESESERAISEGVLPILRERFDLPIESYTGCIECFCSFVWSYIQHRFLTCYQTAAAPVTVTCQHAKVFITFYPYVHDRPILIRDGMDVYKVTERVIPGHWVDNTDSYSSPDEMEIASMAISAPATANVFAIRKKDPSIEEIGDPCDLGNFLPDSGATQHMTPCQADLFDVVEGQNLGVEVVDGHIIKCSVTGKIQLQMIDDSDHVLEAILHDVMYVPGLS